MSVASVLTTLPMASLAPAHAAAASSDVAAGDMLAQTVYLPIAHPAAAEAAARAIQTPGPGYHKFLSVSEFVKTYAPTDATLRAVEAALTSLGYTVVYVFPNHLAIQVVSSAATAQSTMGVTLKRVTVNGRTGIIPSGPLTVPASLKGMIRGIGGLTMSHAHPQKLVAALGRSRTPHAVTGALVGGTPGDYLPADFEKFYDVNPIYAHGIDGHGTTVGIVTLANFYPSDAYLFWKGIGLKVSQSRITTVDVDGGTSIAPSDALGEGETDIDVQESGALAPAAKERVYIAPNNTNANFIDGFEAAASENVAETVSTSWGEAELYYFADLVGDPSETFVLDAFHDAFLEMALQGQSMFVAAGDSGSFDTVEDCSPYGTASADSPVCSAPYAIDSPSDDPLVTAAGGTTLPFSFTLTDGLRLSVAKERAWSWDYISSEAAAQGYGKVFPVASVFSVGGGGGVSSYFAKPWYQGGVPGITRTVPNQTFTENVGTGPVAIDALPSNFAGRNSPDLSTNADPESGYQYIEEGQIVDGYGGTSFVAPQLNGVTSLFVQGTGSRVGALNPTLYALGTTISRDIRLGDNWGYKAVSGYDNAVGVGVLDATRLIFTLAALKAIH